MMMMMMMMMVMMVMMMMMMMMMMTLRMMMMKMKHAAKEGMLSQEGREENGAKLTYILNDTEHVCPRRGSACRPCSASSIAHSILILDIEV